MNQGLTMFDKDTKDGSLRLMTPGEIKMAREIFRDTINYPKVWIHKGSYLPFGLQLKRASMSPNGEMYLREYYSSDYSKTHFLYQHTFIHELSHVWQFQHGMNVKLRGLISWAAPYKYALDSWPLSTYRMEQQASIIADYYLLTQFNGHTNWRMNRLCTNCDDLSFEELMQQYKYTLRAFP
ncbi:type IV secretion protein Rhs [Erwinia sp. MYb375]|uniref:type IV secretion protein Rhs n=1 Tax=Erwinia sp. MYb375 TaxID=2745272 RepID=UPI00309C0EEE